MGGLPAGAGALVGQQLGKYDLVALLALGGTAEIYLARIDGTAGFEKFVVVKCLHDHLAEDPEFVSMFLDEARLGAALDHSNIVQTLGLGEHEDRYYMVMEFIAGLSLALVGRRAHERVRGGKVPVPIVLNVAAQAAAGLHYAHERTVGLVHRDISPQNLVITFEGIVKVVDFGIAKADYRETRTRSGTVKGKFAYMSPEQCQAGDVDRRTDVFALGVIVWELLTGRRLFKRDSTYETYQAVIACNVVPPSTVNHELDPALDAIVMAALAKDREARYPTAEAFGEALMGYLHHRGKPSGAGEIARFFEESFAQEIEDHYARMRELIEGRRKSIADQKLIQWDASELDGSASSVAPEDIEELIEQSTAAPPPVAAATSGAVGPVSPPMASRAATVPVRGRFEAAPTASESITDAEDLHGDDFDGGDTADVAEGGPTQIDLDPSAVIAAYEAARKAIGAPPGPPPPVAGSKKPEPPPRRAASVITPPGMRAGGAPIDLSQHEREQMLAAATPPPSTVPPAKGFAAAPSSVPTVLAPAPASGPARFADVPTVHAAGAPRGFAAAPAQVPTVIADGSRDGEPTTGQTQMLTPEDLVEVGPATGAHLAAPASPGPPGSPGPGHAPLPLAAQIIAPPTLEPRQMAPWMLGVMFVVVLAIATGVTVAIARAFS